jgi:hypothetical protein
LQWDTEADFDGQEAVCRWELEDAEGFAQIELFADYG